MKDCKTIEAIEKNTFDCMEWMENKIKDVVKNLMKWNDEQLNMAGADNNYIEGYHDALIDIMNELEIEMEN